MSKAWVGGSTSAWRRTRALVLARDGHRCQLRIEGVCTGRATHVHHTVGRAVSGDDPAHLLASCSSCNYKLGDVRANDPAPRPSSWA